MENTQGMTFAGFLAGVVGGWFCVLTGQPFDIVKVRLQSSNQTSSVQVVKKLVKYEGVRAFWKGSLPPMIGVGIDNAIVFGVQENCKRVFSSWNEPGEVLSLKQHALSGCISGLVSSVASTPAEGLRIRMQVQKTNYYKNSVDCIKRVTKEHGVKGLYRGFTSTCVRDTIGCGVFFWVYQGLARKVFGGEGKNAEDMKLWQVFVSGGLAGLGFWIPVYPIDVIKSRMQADSLINPRYSSTLACINESLKESGVLFRGMVPCALRAFPAFASTVLGVELTMSVFGRDYK